MKLPNGEKAIISMDKIINYCLNPDHSRGKNKAKVFKSSLGITKENANVLFSLIQQAAIKGEIIQQSTTEFGEQYKVDWNIPDNPQITLRTIWEIKSINSNPRLISAFIK